MTALVIDQWQDLAGTDYKECLQVVTAQWDQDPDLYFWINSSTASGWFDTGLQVTIRAKKSNSRFFIIADTQGYYDTASTGSGVNIGIYRGSTEVSAGSTATWMGYANAMSQTASSYSLARTAYDSPNVAQGTDLTYKIYFGKYSANTARCGFGWPGYISFNKIIVMELEA